MCIRDSSWANNLKVCFIDDFADQTIGIATTNVSAWTSVGYGVTKALSHSLPGIGTTSAFTGYVKGIVTGIATDSTNGVSFVHVKVTDRVSSAGTATPITYAEGTKEASFLQNNTVFFTTNAGVQTGPTGANATAGINVDTVEDWYDNQTLGLTNSVVYWKSLAPKPTTNVYVNDRKGANDACHVAVVDDLGTVTGIQGNLLEKHVSLSKAADIISCVNAPQKTYYKNYLANYSDHLYAGYNPSIAEDAYWGTNPVATGFSLSLIHI